MAIVAVGLATYVGIFLHTVRAGFVRAPFGDGFDILKVEFEAQDRNDPGFYLWHPHNGHHIFWLRLLTSLDVRVFHGQSTIIVVAALLALLGAAGLLARETWRGVEDTGLAPPLAAIAPLVLLTSLNAFDVSVPINTPYVLATAFAVAAFVVAEHGEGGFGRLLALLALAAAAGMGNSVGLAAVPVLMIAVRRRPHRGLLPLLWVAGPILVALFVLTAGQMAVEGAQPAATLFDRGVRLVRYYVSFCGLPWSSSSQRMSLSPPLQTLVQFAGPGLGAILIVLGLALAARPAKGDAPRARLDRICCSLILFSLAAAAMAALGRGGASPALQIPVRYAVIMAPLQIGVLVLLAIRNPALSRASNATLCSTVAAILVVGIVHQVLGQSVILRYCAHLNQTLAAFNAGQRTPEMTEYVHPNMRHAEQVTAEMKRRGVYQ